MEWRDVQAALREHVRPVLRQGGFAKFEGSTAWRFHEHIDVVTFRRLGSENAEQFGATESSFVIELGIWLNYVPGSFLSQTPRVKDGQLLPQVARCPLMKTVRAPRRREVAVPELFLVSEDGLNLDDVIADAELAVAEIALPWFASLRTPEQVADLLERPEGAQRHVWHGPRSLTCPSLPARVHGDSAW